MAKNSSDEQVLKDVLSHYEMWTDDNDIRRTRKNGWDDVTEAYWGRLPKDWPYTSRVVDPRIRTSLIEKNARLLNAKLRGRLVPREGSDVIKARINNALLDFQWDNANYGGSMLDKWGKMDMDTRLYASKFGLVKWRHEERDGKVVFDGNELTPLDIRDCGLDPSAEHIRSAKWFQHREWAKIEDMEEVSDISGDLMYPGLNKLKELMQNNSDKRENAYVDKVLSLKGLSDRVGDDKAHQTIEVVTEYCEDYWITFSPRYKHILRKIKNPYKHGKIPVVQLRYYPIQGDPHGESEVEPVIPLWRAIQATVCGYLDNMNIHMRPPLKVIDGAARIETIAFGAEAQWIVDRPDAVTEFQSNGEAMRYFQSTYQALTSAFNTAMGDISQGVSAIDPTNGKKTATEIKQSFRQQNVRDEKNQASLSESIQDMMGMWVSNNQQFLFADKEKVEYIVRIVGPQLYNGFKQLELDEMQLPGESAQVIADIIGQHNGDLTDQEIQSLAESGKVPKYPVFTNPKEKDPEKLMYKPKMRIDEDNSSAEISITPDDLDGTFDYIPSVKSMASGAGEELIAGRQKALEMIASPIAMQQLSKEGVEPAFKDLFTDILEDMGLRDSDRYFRPIQQLPQGPAQQGPMPALPQGADQSTPPEMSMMGGDQMSQPDPSQMMMG